MFRCPRYACKDRVSWSGIGQGETARVPQHVRVGLEGEAGRLTGTLDKLGKARGDERCAALSDEHEWRWRALVRRLLGAKKPCECTTRA